MTGPGLWIPPSFPVEEPQAFATTLEALGKRKMALHLGRDTATKSLAIGSCTPIQRGRNLILRAEEMGSHQQTGVGTNSLIKKYDVNWPVCPQELPRPATQWPGQDQ